MKVLFLYLKAFSFTGGIEKFNRSFLKALHELSVDGFFDAGAISAYDSVSDEKYFASQRFLGFRGARPVFALVSLIKALRYEMVVIGHINLAIIGCMIKWVRPNIRLVLIAHGIEVWQEMTGYKKKLLERADIVLAVSNFTKEKLTKFNSQIDPTKIRIFPNTIDPYVIPPKEFIKPAYLLTRYGVLPNDPIVLTVSRLASSERYKGYDGIIKLMPELLKMYPHLKYFICGNADTKERGRIEAMIEYYKVSHAVVLTGFVKDSELTDHYLLADLFVMQSKKEGFGIVFIEALACGRKVIAGNKDGSVDALAGGTLGTLIDPDQPDELKTAILNGLAVRGHRPEKLRDRVIDLFGFSAYKRRLGAYLIGPIADQE
ncbi:MAG TPA: glycosyltransferase family 4 protein [Cyclobacteriaceae bacterium]|nr:glycosyltransferase family 4 protein [Cyclobacteriaceae bacterium]